MALLEIRGLTRSFGGLVAVDHVDLDVPERGLTGLIGPNGAGKTTLFNLITGLYAPDSGEIRLEGKNLAGGPPHLVARHGVARTFQNIRLFPTLSVLDNILIGSHVRSPETFAEAMVGGDKHRSDETALREHAMGVLEALGIAAFANDLASNLPYGEQRRVEIARALAAEPRLLLLDEPACGMNPQETQDLMTLVRSLRDERGLSVLLIEHDMRFVMTICEHIYVLDYGQVIASGAPEEIRNDPRVVEAYLGEPMQ